MTRSPGFTPPSTSTCVPMSRVTLNLRLSVIDNRHLQAVAVEDDSVGGHDEGP